MREAFARMRDWFRRGQLGTELQEELRFHRDRLERDAAASRAPGDDVAHIASRRLGSELRARESARERWSFPWMERMAQDVRYALRGLRRSPAFTLTVVTTLALGIGANAAMFGVIDRLMFRPAPYLRAPEQVHRVYLQTTSRGQVATRNQFAYTRYLDLQRFSGAVAQSAAFSEWSLAIGTGDAAREYQVAGVSASFFTFFDARPALGRFFAASEDSVPRGANVAVLSYAFWQSEFAGRNVIGQQMQIGPLGTTIIGVAPEGFIGVAEGEPPAVFMPITAYAYGVGQGDARTFSTKYNWDWMSIMVRGKPGISAQRLTADLTSAFIQSRNVQRAQNPAVVADSIARPRAIAGALKTSAGPDAGLEAKTLLWVSGVAVIVLLIACANVANLMFARVLGRRREIALRLALGVSRRRLTSQLFTESVILATSGCVVGIVLAQWVTSALRELFSRDGSPLHVATDWRTLVAASACALVAGTITAVGPALFAVRENLATTLRAGGRGATNRSSRTRSVLLVFQGALSVILLVGAGLFVRSLENVRSMHLGWDPAPVLIVTPNYRGVQLDSATRIAFRDRLLVAAQSIPGVTYAARINSMPFGTNTRELHVAGIDSVERLGRFNYQLSSRDYFKAMDTRIIRGRAFNAQDREDSPPVVIVSRAMGRALWPGQDPVGQCVHVGPVSVPCTTVIGVAEDAVQGSMDDTERFLYYLADEQAPYDPATNRPRARNPGNRLFLRMSGAHPADLVERVRGALQRVMPGQAYVTVMPLEDVVNVQRRSWQLGATMFVAFGVLALIVAAVGLYGVIGYNVAQRMHELGVRIALGAQSSDVARLIVGQGASFAGAGLVFGLSVALAASRWMQPLLFNESARDPIVYGVVGVLIMIVAVAASMAPALRASRADPNTVLRTD